MRRTLPNTTTETKSPRPILVTGAHRTGTTWVGKMLAAGGEAGYISEPLNVLHRPGVFGAPLSRWYTYICAANESQYLPALLETLAVRYHLEREIPSLRSQHDLKRMGRDWWNFINGSLRHQRPLLKDPFAIFSIPWFIERLNSQVIVTIRHPAAFASSLKRLNWPFDFQDLLDQPLLMDNVLGSQRRAIEAILHTPGDVIGQASLLWRLVYQVVDAYRRQYPQVQICRHEDLSLAPVEGFRQLYNWLGLNWTERAEHAILNASSSENPSETTKKAVHTVRLDSKANLQSWKKHMTPEEIQRVRMLTEDVIALYYQDVNWD